VDRVVTELLPQHLDGPHAAQHDLLGPIDFAHAARAEQLDEPVTLEERRSDETARGAFLGRERGQLRARWLGHHEGEAS